ncbi:MAG: phosphopyruvate hydratase [Candidatus Levyibacteriota bacterium]
MTKLTQLEASWILDSRGNPTVKATASYGDITVCSGVPSGASTGSREALELRDGGKAFLGKGVEKAVANVKNVIAPEVSQIDIFDQRAIDEKMIVLDGTDNKSHLGANAILAVSLVISRLASAVKKVPYYTYLGELLGEKDANLLPTPMMNVINGGRHATNGLDFQEFMIVPSGASTFSKALQMGAEIYAYLGKIIDAHGVGDEGGYSPSGFIAADGRDRVIETLDLLLEAIDKAGYKAGKDVSLALDPAASEFYKNEKYVLANETLSSDEMVSFYETLVKKFPIVSIEDGMAEHDHNGWKKLTDKLGEKVQIVGDDLFVTNPKIFTQGIQDGLANAILVKLNQIGTVSETLDVIEIAKKHNYNYIISHRSGETEYTTISDLAVGTRAGQIKTGSLARSDRVAKYNRLLEIEKELGEKAEFADGKIYGK